MPRLTYSPEQAQRKLEQAIQESVLGPTGRPLEVAVSVFDVQRDPLQLADNSFTVSFEPAFDARRPRADTGVVMRQPMVVAYALPVCVSDQHSSLLEALRLGAAIVRALTQPLPSGELATPGIDCIPDRQTLTASGQRLIGRIHFMMTFVWRIATD